jgi:hypothetical protein
MTWTTRPPTEPGWYWLRAPWFWVGDVIHWVYRD